MILLRLYFFVYNATATPELYTLSLHDALPISAIVHTGAGEHLEKLIGWGYVDLLFAGNALAARSEEHTSELQSRGHLVCRLLLEKKKMPHQRVRHSLRRDSVPLRSASDCTMGL